MGYLEKSMKLHEIDKLIEKLLYSGTMTITQANEVLNMLGSDIKISEEHTTLNFMAIIALLLTKKVIEIEKE